MRMIKGMSESVKRDEKADHKGCSRNGFLFVCQLELHLQVVVQLLLVL